MNIPMVLTLNSIPFAAMVCTMMSGEKRDVFLISYAACLGLMISLIAIVDGGFLLTVNPQFPAETIR